MVSVLNPWVLISVFTVLFYLSPFIILLVLTRFIKDKRTRKIYIFSILISLFGLIYMKKEKILKHNAEMKKEKLNK